MCSQRQGGSADGCKSQSVNGARTDCCCPGFKSHRARGSSCGRRDHTHRAGESNGLPTTEGFNEDSTTALVPPWFTVCVNTAEVLPLTLVSPLYTAVMECAPSASPEVLKVVHPLPLSVPVPSVVVPSLNVTLPVAAPVAGASTLTVAVKVTGWPTSVGVWEEASAVELEPGPTFCVTADEVLPVKLASPP